MTEAVRILIVEDRPDDAVLMVRQLQRLAPACHTERVETEAEFLAQLTRFQPQVILTDHSLPRFSARDVLQLTRIHAPEVPVIVVTGSLDEETAADYIKEGATDYIVKHHLERLGPAVARAIALSQAQASQHRAQAALRTSEAQLRAILNAALDAVVTADGDGRIVGWNEQAETIFGWRAEEAMGLLLTDTIVPSDQREGHASGMTRFHATGHGPILNRRIEMPGQHRSGRIIPLELSVVPVRVGEAWMFSAFIRDLTEQRAREAALRATESRLQQVVAASGAVIYVMKVSNGAFLPSWVSENITRLTGFAVEEAMGPTWWIDHVHPADRERVRAELAGLLVRREQSIEYRFAFRDGSYHWIVDEARLVLNAEGHPVELVGTWFDVTERRNLESQLQHAQRLEAVGQLAGGIAHDFNNVLTAIAGNADLLLSDLPVGDPRRADAEEIRASTMRAAALTRQLLAFSRRQVLQPQVVELGAVVTSMSSMLRRLIGEHIELTCLTAPDLGDVEADRGQVEQVILNLVMNARDAMDGGGRISIETANADFDEGYIRTHPPAVAGRYVLLAVSDTGHGMTPETQQRVFEPFFTTKEVGRGTGLGLATVYGIVKQSGGFIWLYSESGRGTTFKVYLPRVTKSGVRLDPIVPEAPLPTGHEVILLVEDEESVRRVSRTILERLGYRVLEAANPAQALGLMAAHAGPIDLLFTDMVMPGMSGRDLVTGILRERPGIRVLYVSGYPGSAREQGGPIAPDHPFLSKPFSTAELAHRVRATLDQPRGG